MISIPALAHVAVACSAIIFFAVQPLFAKTMLPRLGGSPSVWALCATAYQLCLCLGCLLVERQCRTTDALKPATRYFIYAFAAIILSALAAQATASWQFDPASGWFVPAAISCVLLTVGPILIVLAGTTPTLHWTAAALSPEARSGLYRLYVTSNVASIAALVAYVLIIEPRFPLRIQIAFLAAVGAVLLAAVGAIVLAGRARGAPRRASERSRTASAEPSSLRAALSRAKAIWWAVPLITSMLTVASTGFLTTDIAPVPLLWTLPLIVLLGAYALAFIRRIPPVLERVASHAAFVGVLWLLLTLITNPIGPAVPTISIHLIIGGLACFSLHRLLFASRPVDQEPTTFYLCIAAGGFLGGLACSVVAPVVFDPPEVLRHAAGAGLPGIVRRVWELTSFAEYAAALALAGILLARSLRRPEASVRQSRRGPARTVALALVAAVITWLSIGLSGSQAGIVRALFLLVPALIVYAMHQQTADVSAAGLALMITAVLTAQGAHEVCRIRSVFGVIRVVKARNANVLQLYHGNTLHGMQSTDGPTTDGAVPAARRYGPAPLGYYHETGPIGQLLTAQSGRIRVGVIGLGAGSLASYVGAGETADFYEIDPAVERVALEHFSYLAEARRRGANLTIVVGDARLTLEREQPDPYDVLVVDAFNSDSIPVHLLTVEAAQMMWSRVRRGGWLVYHITNRHLDMQRVLAGTADAMGLQLMVARDEADPSTGKLGSTWAVLCERDRSPADLGSLWSTAGSALGAVKWYDDYSSLLPIIRY